MNRFILFMFLLSLMVAMTAPIYGKPHSKPKKFKKIQNCNKIGVQKVKSFGNHQYMWRHTMWKTHTNKTDKYLYHQNKRLVPILVVRENKYINEPHPKF